MAFFTTRRQLRPTNVVVCSVGLKTEPNDLTDKIPVYGTCDKVRRFVRQQKDVRGQSMSLVLASFAVVTTNPTALERKKTLACNKSLNLVLTNLSSNQSSSSTRFIA